MLVKLEYNLPEEKDEFLIAYNGLNFFSTLRNIEEKVRLWSKDGHNFKNAEECIEEIRRLLNYEVENELHYHPDR